MPPLFSLASLLTYLPMIVSGAAFVAIVVVFLRRRDHLSAWAIKLLIGLGVFRILYAFFLSFLQYVAWQESGVAQYLLPPHQPWSYFLFYSAMHFGFYPLLSFLAMLVVTLFFIALRKIKHEWFEDGEIPLAVLLALVLGWPSGLFLIPATFLFAAIIAVVYSFRGITTRIPIGRILLGVTLILFLFGTFFVHLLHMEGLYAS